MTDDIKRFENESVNCDIVRDLLPLYHDGVVSDATKAAVEHHLSTCAECRAENEMYNEKIPLQQVERQNSGDKFLEFVHKRKLKRIFITVLCSALTCILLIGAWFMLTQAPMVYDEYDECVLVKIYRYESYDGGEYFFLLYDQPSYETPSTTIGGTLIDGSTLTVEETQRHTIISTIRDESPRMGMIRWVKAGGITEVKFQDEIVWTEEENGDNEVPDYVYAYDEVIRVSENGSFSVDMNMGYIKVSYPNGTVKIWDLDGELVTDQFSAK